MGVMKRLRGLPSGLKEGIDDVYNKGFFAGLLNIGKRFSEKNAETFRTLGEDIKR